MKDGFLKEQNYRNIVYYVINKDISQCKTIFLTFTYLLRLIEALQTAHHCALGTNLQLVLFLDKHINLLKVGEIKQYKLTSFITLVLLCSPTVQTKNSIKEDINLS